MQTRSCPCGSLPIFREFQDELWRAVDGYLRLKPDGGVVAPAAEKGRVRPMAALYLLERMFHVMTDGKLLNPLIAALMGGGCGGGGRGGALVSLSEDEPVSPPGGVQMWDPKQVTSSKPRRALIYSTSSPHRLVVNLIHGNALLSCIRGTQGDDLSLTEALMPTWSQTLTGVYSSRPRYQRDAQPDDMVLADSPLLGPGCTLPTKTCAAQTRVEQRYPTSAADDHLHAFSHSHRAPRAPGTRLRRS